MTWRWCSPQAGWRRASASSSPVWSSSPSWGGKAASSLAAASLLSPPSSPASPSNTTSLQSLQGEIPSSAVEHFFSTFNSYGVVSASAANIIVLATIVIPVTWFPAHRGKVIGLVTSGYGLSSTLFTPLQTALVNPANIPPVRQAGGHLLLIKSDSSVTAAARPTSYRTPCWSGFPTASNAWPPSTRGCSGRGWC